MKCSNVIVPGLNESEKFLVGHKDIAMKMRAEIEASDYEKVSVFKEIPGYKPQNIVKSYKLFRVKGNRLYPLFVDAQRAIPLGQWLQATAGKPGKKNKEKVSSSIGELAYRPGWHAGAIPVATHIGGKVNLETGRRMVGKKVVPTMREDNTVWAEVEMPADFDWQTEANSRASIVKGGDRAGLLNLKEAHITDQMPDHGFYKYKTNSNMTGTWLISGQMKVNKILSDAEVREINEDAGFQDLLRSYEMPFMENPEAADRFSTYEKAPAKIKKMVTFALERGYDDYIIRTDTRPSYLILKTPEGDIKAKNETELVHEIYSDKVNTIGAARKQIEAKHKDDVIYNLEMDETVDGVQFRTKGAQMGLVGPYGYNEMHFEDVQLDKKLRGKGWGKKMYLNAINYALERGDINYLNSDAQVSEEAKRVWNSLKNMRPSQLKELGFPHLAGTFKVQDSIFESGAYDRLEDKKGFVNYQQNTEEPLFTIELYPNVYKSKNP